MFGSAEEKNNQLVEAGDAEEMGEASMDQSHGHRLGSEANEALKIVNVMRDSGLQSTLDMPRLVFCGNQSAAKSSLVEALFGVPLPRGDGTCTRSVTEVRSECTPNAPFTAKVSLRWEYDDKMNKEREITITEHVGDAATRADITLLCEFGQLILLNPDHHFDPKTRDSDLVSRTSEQMELKFTRNVVCVEVYGPEEGNLSGIDLPGLIAYTDNPEDEQYIELVRNLSIDYAKNENTIIVPVVSCKYDLENQGMIKLARDADPREERTLLVMTKADLIEEGLHQGVVDILMGKVYKFKLGYFIVKCASKAQRVKYNPDHNMVRDWEKEFFNTTEPWASAVPDLKRRCGIMNVSQTLSTLLVKQINSQMPRMKAQVLERLEWVRTELKNMPEQVHPDRMRHLLLDMIEEAQEEMQARGMESLWDNVKFNYSKFIAAIKRTAPRFELLEDPAQLAREAEQRARAEDSDSDSDSDSDEEGEGNDEEKQEPLPLPLSMEDVLKAMVDVESRQMRDVPYNARKALITQFVRKWAIPVQSLVSIVRQLINEELDSVIEKAFGRFFKLHGKALGHTKNLLVSHEEGVRDMVDVLVEMEVRDPFTVRQSDLDYFHAQYLSKLYRSYVERQQRDYEIPRERMDQILAGIKKLGMQDISERQLLFLHQQNRVGKEHQDRHDSALKVMAGTKAYFDVSSVRFCEDSCRTITKVMIDDFAKSMKTMLIEKLGVVNMPDEEMIPLFVEDEELMKRRQELINFQKKLIPVARAFKN